MKSQLLTEADAADALGVPVQTLKRLRLDTKTAPPVPHCAIGANVRYDLGDLLSWAKTQRKATRRRVIRTKEEFARLR